MTVVALPLLSSFLLRANLPKIHIEAIPSIIAKSNPPEYSHEYQDDLYQYSNSHFDSPRGNKISSVIESLVNLWNNPKQLGASLLGFGLLISFFGMMLFFESNLLRIGNVCILLGLPLLLGVDRMKEFFIRKERARASLIIAAGVVLVLAGKTRFGIALEIFGILNLFGNMNPFVIALIKKTPILGEMVVTLEDMLKGGRRRMKHSFSKDFDPHRKTGSFRIPDEDENDYYDSYQHEKRNPRGFGKKDRNYSPQF